MADLTRRNLFKQMMVTGAGATLAQVALVGGVSEQASAAPAASGEPRGRLLVAGFGGRRHSATRAAASTVVTDIDVATGQYRQEWLEMGNGHTVLSLPQAGFLCLPQDGELALFLDDKLRQIAPLTAPEGHFFSGHGVVIGHLVYLSARMRNARSFNDHGQILIVDSQKRQIIGSYDSGGVRPHDIVTDTSGNIIVSHYGDINYEAAGKNNQNVRQPRLVTMDHHSGKIVNIVDALTMGSLTHIARNAQGVVCGVPLSYHGYDEQGRRAVEALLGGAPFELSVAEELEGRIAAPMPVLLFDKNGTCRQVKGDAVRHRRAQSVASHASTGRFFVTYSFSDTLACIDGEKISYVSGFDLGLSFVRGVCALGESDYVAVTGEFRGVSIVNAKTLRVLRRIDVPLFDNPHVVSV